MSLDLRKDQHATRGSIVRICRATNITQVYQKNAGIDHSITNERGIFDSSLGFGTAEGLRRGMTGSMNFKTTVGWSQSLSTVVIMERRAHYILTTRVESTSGSRAIGGSRVKVS